MGNVGVRVECVIRDGVPAGNEDIVARQVAFHDTQGIIPTLHLLRQGYLVLINRSGEMPESDNRDIGLMTVLLKEEPLKNLSSLPWLMGKVGGFLRQEEQNRVRLWQTAAIRPFDKRNAVVRVLSKVFRPACLTIEDIKMHALETVAPAGSAAGGPYSSFRIPSNRTASASQTLTGDRLAAGSRPYVWRTVEVTEVIFQAPPRFS